MPHQIQTTPKKHNLIAHERSISYSNTGNHATAQGNIIVQGNTIVKDNTTAQGDTIKRSYTTERLYTTENPYQITPFTKMIIQVAKSAFQNRPNLKDQKTLHLNVKQIHQNIRKIKRMSELQQILNAHLNNLETLKTVNTDLAAIYNQNIIQPIETWIKYKEASAQLSENDLQTLEELEKHTPLEMLLLAQDLSYTMSDPIMLLLEYLELIENIN